MNELFKDKKYYASLDGLVSLDYDFFIAVEDYFEENLKSSKKKEKEKESIVKDYILSLLDSFEEVETQLENISTNLQQRYQYNEKTVLIDGKTTEIKHMIDLIENQITFFNESIKTVDNVLFGIKTRVEIEKVLGI
jgi:hypothetical protein